MRRSMLFMPGINPGNILNADSFYADSIILDLEDAVAYAEKDAARVLTRNALRELKFHDVEVIVRINDLSTTFWDDCAPGAGRDYAHQGQQRRRHQSSERLHRQGGTGPRP